MLPRLLMNLRRAWNCQICLVVVVVVVVVQDNKRERSSSPRDLQVSFRLKDGTVSPHDKAMETGRDRVCGWAEWGGGGGSFWKEERRLLR